jgi:plasmid stabilization system protein ParE
VNIVFTPEAADELEQVLDQISTVSPLGAEHVGQRIQKVLEYINTYPHAGTNANHAGMRRLVVNPYPYAIYYRLADDFIIVIGIRHTAQNPANMPDAG